MDATELIEEAGRVAAQAAKQSALDLYYSPCTCSAPPRGHTTRQHDYRRLQVDELRAVLDVVERLAAALQASEERARKAEQDRDTLAAANRDANKRIVELEHERDAALAELAQPYSCPNCTAKLRRLDRMDSAGHAAYELDKARKDAAGQNKRAQKAEQEAKALRAELARLTTPRPIAEAPRKAGSQIIALWMHGDEVESMDVVCWADMDDGDHPERKFWMNTAGDVVEHMTHYLPMPEVKP